MLTEFVGEIRLKNGRKALLLLMLFINKKIETAENKGYDAGKKVSGIKRHLAVDTQGLPHAIHITTANVCD
jgi:hypothetical protein